MQLPATKKAHELSTVNWITSPEGGCRIFHWIETLYADVALSNLHSEFAVFHIIAHVTEDCRQYIINSTYSL